MYVGDLLCQKVVFLCIFLIADLVENRTVGIIDLLDEECKLPKGSSHHFTETVHHTHRAHFRLSVSTNCLWSKYTLITYDEGKECQLYFEGRNPDCFFVDT